MNSEVGTFRLSELAARLYVLRTGGTLLKWISAEATSRSFRGGQGADRRSAPVLVKLVEEPGELASGPESNLEVVSVSAGVQWHLFSVCGIEFVLKSCSAARRDSYVRQLPAGRYAQRNDTRVR